MGGGALQSPYAVITYQNLSVCQEMVENLKHTATSEELWELINAELRCLFPVVHSPPLSVATWRQRADVIESTLVVTDYLSCLITLKYLTVLQNNTST